MRLDRLLGVLTLGAWVSRAQGAVVRRLDHDTQYPLHAGSGEVADLDADGAKFNADLRDVLDAIRTMQQTYFDVFAGTWTNAIDWTAAVMGTHLSATIASLVEGLNLTVTGTCSDTLKWENLINNYHTHIGFFYYGENALSLRTQANDDMLWVVLGWLESIKFTGMFAQRHDYMGEEYSLPWHGTQLAPMAAHRARIFYDLASAGWDDDLCGGGMVWNSRLTPYKNAITNELFAAASISMYLYFPGDNNTSPFGSRQSGCCDLPERDPRYLENAVKAYKWLQDSRMVNTQGLYRDGFHISGWRRFPNGTIDPGTGRCDEIDSMVYTYNQGVLLTANRGLWVATGARSYLDEGHQLVNSVIRATGWQSKDHEWHGLGRDGILEEYCDHTSQCSQDGQTFKGIFFHHLIEFCRSMRQPERDVIFASIGAEDHSLIYSEHMNRCAGYREWINHNADAAATTRNKDGLFGMWWSSSAGSSCDAACRQIQQTLPGDVDDHRNPPFTVSEPLEGEDINDRGRGRTVETQSGALAVLRARWIWHTLAQS